MKLSTNFVKDYVDVDVNLKQLAEDMTRVGNEYDSAERLINATKLVIGEIVECTAHPDSDHLHLCKVNVGNEILNIVCGAPNARKGLKVIVALDGAELPGKTIKKGMIRGQESNGMLCSIAELGLEHKFLKPEDSEGIAELGEDAVIGEDPIKYMQMDDGVSNFYPDRFVDIAHFAEIKPAVNQVELHVFQQQQQAREIMKKYNTQPMSWGPFAEGRNNFFQNETLQKIGEKHHKTVAQTALRFLIQENVVVIPKSVHKERMEQNFDIFDFNLSAGEMETIRRLDTENSLFFSHYDPETVEFLVNYKI